MKTVVLCVDRDNDLGVKAGLDGPVIGREDNIRAALTLGIKDPGDTDTNSIFAAIKLYDELKAEGRDVSIATITGDIKVGLKSDEMIRKQMTEIVEKLNPMEAILVTDGAEDEYITPIVASVVNVVHLERVVIKKAKTMEDTYYAIVHVLEDEKIQRKFMVPLGILFLALSLIALTGHPEVGISLLGILLGLYLLIKSYKLEAPLRVLFGDLKEALETKKYITTVSILLGLFVSMAGVILGISFGITDNILETALNFISYSLWYIIAGVVIYMIGSSIDIYIKEKHFLWNVTYSVMAAIGTGFMGVAILEVARFLFLGDVTMPIVATYGYFVVGTAILVLSLLINKYIRDHVEPEYKTPSTWLR